MKKLLLRISKKWLDKKEWEIFNYEDQKLNSRFPSRWDSMWRKGQILFSKGDWLIADEPVFGNSTHIYHEHYLGAWSVRPPEGWKRHFTKRLACPICDRLVPKKVANVYRLLTFSNVQYL